MGLFGNSGSKAMAKEARRAEYVAKEMVRQAKYVEKAVKRIMSAKGRGVDTLTFMPKQKHKVLQAAHVLGTWEDRQAEIEKLNDLVAEYLGSLFESLDYIALEYESASFNFSKADLPPDADFNFVVSEDAVEKARQQVYSLMLKRRQGLADFMAKRLMEKLNIQVSRADKSAAHGVKMQKRYEQQQRAA